MSSDSVSPVLHRRSLCASSNSFSSPSQHPHDITKSYRFSSLRNPRLPYSPPRGSIFETSPRPRTPLKSSRKSKDTCAPALSKRMSFIDFGNDSPNRLLGSLRERLLRKKSAPLLDNSFFTPTTAPIGSPTMLTARPPQFASNWSRFSTARDDTTVTSLEVDANPLLSFKEERKLTVMPEEVVDGMGYGVRESRQASVADSDASEDVDVSKAGYRAVPFRRKGCMLLHSYLRSDAPYMKSYNKVDLQNDIYFHLLLRRLNTTGTPSFREYSFPPEDILDLGCGQGTWAQEAAAAWAEAGTKIVGYDLVDLVSKIARTPPGTVWKRGNFVAYRLPFKPASFDLVRLANLTEAVPQSRWEHVLVEVRRVLKPTGRVEIIDDEIIFAYPDLAPRTSGFRTIPNSDPHTAHASWGSDEFKLSNEILDGHSCQVVDSSFLDLDSAVDRTSIGSAPGLYRDDSPSEESCDYLPTPTGCINDMPTSVEPEALTTDHHTQMPPAPLCREIEKIYESMLEGVYRVNLRPGDLLESLLRKVFGPAGKATTLKDFQLSLLSPAMHDLVVMTKHMNSAQDNIRRSKKLFKVDRDGRRFDKNKEIRDKVIISQSKSKALRVLGARGPPTPVCDPISTRMSDDSDFNDEPAIVRPMMLRRASSGISTLAFPPSTRPSSSSSAASQPRSHHGPTGLFLYPDQFLETTPLELERYLCKHIDTLLSCKAALDEHALNLRDENGGAIVQEDEWNDMLWEYERSRRERFNLPDVGGQFDDTEDDEYDLASLLKEPIRHSRTIIQPVATAINNHSRLLRSSFGPSDTIPSSTLVRRIRVFEAYKTKPFLPP